MQKRKWFFPSFFLFLTLSILLFILSSLGLTRGLSGFLESVTLPIQKFTFNTFHKNEDSDEIKRLKNENQELTSQLTKQAELQKENDALRSQFQLTDPSPKQLIPATIIGQGQSTITIDKGKAEGVHTGMIAVFKNNLIGKISVASVHLSQISLLNSNDFSTTARTLKTNALGIVKGDGNNFVMGSVVLSEKLEKGDLVVTKGDIDASGKGFPPGLVLGRIDSIDKRESNLFQSAGLKSLVDPEKQEMVFVIIKK